MTSPPSIAFISPIMPAFTGNGLAMRMAMFARALARISSLHIIVVPVAGEIHDAAFSQRFPDVRISHIDIAGRIGSHYALLSRLARDEARVEAFERFGQPSLSRFLSVHVLADIRRAVEAGSPDAIHIGRSYLLPCMDALADTAPISVDLDDDDYSSFQSQARLAHANGDVLRARWLRLEADACSALIARHGPRLSRLFVTSASDLPSLRLRHPALSFEVAENSIEIAPRRPRVDDGSTILFVGNLNYAPNAEGIAWFCRRVLPRLRSRPGGAFRLLVAGGGAPAVVRALGRLPRVALLGQAPDLSPLYRVASIAIAPLHAGGGTRIKLLEAAAQGVASVATPLAAEGLGWPAQVGGWRADGGAFAAACRAALRNRAERDRRALLGRDWVSRHHGAGPLTLSLSRRLMSVVTQARNDR